MVFFRRNRDKIEKMLDDYFEHCDSCVRLFAEAFEIFLHDGHGELFSSAVQSCHEAESAADDLRREIELTLYGKGLLPDSRGDILGLLETYDRLPNIAESILFSMLCQKTNLPEVLRADFKKLVDLNLEAYYLARKSVDALMNNPKATLHATKDVDEKESESDRCERAIISRVFAGEFDAFDKLLLRDLVLLIGDISDRAERAADRISIVAIKRQI